MTVQEAWDERRKLYIEAEKYHKHGSELNFEEVDMRHKSTLLYNEGKTLESLKFLNKAHILYALKNQEYSERDKLRAEGTLLFLEAVFNFYGEVLILWKSNNCIIEGIEYEWELKDQICATCEGKEIVIDGIKYTLARAKQ